MTLVAGSYEKFVWGFKLKTLKSSETLTLTQLFSYPSHLSPIKSVAVSAPLAATSSSDDTVKLYSLTTLSDLATLSNHTAAVTSVAFFSLQSTSLPRNLLTASLDGSVCIYDADPPFVLLKTVSGVHKTGVSDIAVHPSGKVALTVGRDSCLAMLNLVRGRRSFYCRLDREATAVRYDSGGERFFMVMEDRVSVHDAVDAKLVFELENQKRVLCAAPGNDGILFTGGEDKNITAWDTTSGKIAYCIEDAHSSRVKGIVVLGRSDGDNVDADDHPHIVASASSDGFIRVWDVRMTNKEKTRPLAEANTKSRLTCLAGSSLRSLKQQQKVGNKDADKEEDVAMEDS